MGRPRNIANIYNPPKSNTHFSEGSKSKGILDDHAIRENIGTKEGTIEHIPTKDNHIVNKKYVDGQDALYLPLTGGTLSGVLNCDAIGLGLDVLHSAEIGNHLEVGNNLTVNGTIINTDFTTLTDNSLADTLHRHSELSASDGSPDGGVSVDTAGRLRILSTTEPQLSVKFSDSFRLDISHRGVFNLIDAGNSNDFIFQEDGNELMRIDTGTGNVGIGAAAPASPSGFSKVLEIQGTTPELLLSDGTNKFEIGLDSGNRLRIIKTGATPNTFCIGTNGFIGINHITPTLPLDVNAKSGMSAIGGICIKLTNKTGSNSVAGQLVQADTSQNDAVRLTSIDEEETFGVFLDSGVANNAEAWVVISGIADVAMEDNTTATRGNWVRSSITEAGYADATNAAPPSPAAFSHFNEIGNCIETVTATGEGTHILARCVLHFN